MITAAVPSAVIEQESPRLTDYESEGFIARRLARSSPEFIATMKQDKFSEGFKLLEMAKQKQEKEKVLRQANVEKQARQKQAQ
jgi:hypothetical protein